MRDQAHESADSPARTAGRKILVVDDDAVYRELLLRALSGIGYETAGAENGIRALSLVPAFRPDLILVDIRMPLMDGLRFLRRLREGEHRAVPAIVLTCVDSRTLALEALVAGANEVLLKPASLDLIGEKVESFCGG
jgi:CheY-like chemotaxis protein